MPLTRMTDEQLDDEFAVFHDPESGLRAIAEVRRPNSADPFDEDEMIARFERNRSAYFGMFTGAVDGLVELSKKDNPRLK